MKQNDSINKTSLGLAVIVIPIYKEKLGAFEVISLNQCIKKLSQHPICFICADDFNFENYKMIMRSSTYQIERFRNHYFGSIQGYNRLMVSKDFYERFLHYRFMLIYQLDAFVFRDELEYWCMKDYDYIGAPWFEGDVFGDENSKMLDFGGNGGFSSRKISSHREVLLKFLKHKTIRMKSARDIWGRYVTNSLLYKLSRTPKMILNYYSEKNTLRYCYENGILNEDVFFVQYIANIYHDRFVVPTSDTAVGFSFEIHPRKLYEINKQQLPFGCHSWQRYDFDFWRSHIEAEGHSLP